MKRPVLLLLISLVFLGCKKEVHTTPISPDLLSGFSYKMGSFWIYRDSITGIFDSFFVAENYTYQDNSIPDPTVDINVVTIRHGDTSIYHPEQEPFWRIDLVANEFLITFNQQGNGYTLFKYPYVTNPGDYLDSTIFASHPTYVLNGTNYSNIEEIHHFYTDLQPKNEGSLSHHDFFFLNNTIGIVKMRIDHPVDNTLHVWELVRFHVVK